MPVARFYKGHPVKRMYRVDCGIKLILVSVTPGVPGRQLVVSQEDWDAYGELRRVASSTTSALREIARQQGK